MEGYNYSLNDIRELYPHLPRAYLDNAAAPLFPKTIPFKGTELVCEQPLGNPHSRGMWGSKTLDLVNEVRDNVLRLMNVDSETHELVFCANATAGIKLVGECLDEYALYYNQDSHTSILGLRELSKSSLSFKGELPEVNASQFMVAYPLQSNFDGRQYVDKPWIHQTHAKGGLVLLDIASYCSTRMPDLQNIECDFAVLSFYKIFGYPDLGALIIRKSAEVSSFLAKRKYYGGGTVDLVTPNISYAVPKSHRYSESLEDGTIPFHTILSLKAAISEYKRLFGRFQNISDHVNRLVLHCKSRLSSISNITLYAADKSPIITFNIHGMGHNEVLEAALARDIHLRAGTMCNIGSFISNSNGLDDQKIISNHRHHGKICNDSTSFIDGIHTGAVRASFGAASTYQEADLLCDFIEEMVKSTKPVMSDNNDKFAASNQAYIEQLITYPIKSCGPMKLQAVRLLSTGLEFDREFCIVDCITHEICTMKKYPQMVLIQPSFKNGLYHIEYRNSGHPPLTIDVPRLPSSWSNTSHHNELLENKDPRIIHFFSQILNKPATIATTKENASKANHSHNFANSSPLLIVNSESAKSLKIENIDVFRANLVLSSSQAWAEETWGKLTNPQYKIDLNGNCRRCNMVCITSEGKSDNFPYMQLNKHRRSEGRIYFGRHATRHSESIDPWLRIGDLLTAESKLIN